MDYPVAKIFRRFMETRIHARDPRPVLDPAEFPWARAIEAEAPRIRKEAERVLARLAQVVNFNDVLPGQRALIQNDRWKSFFLAVLGEAVPNHQSLCPETARALGNVPGLLNAFFSILTPGAHIPAHRGPYSGILRFHLGLVIPEGDVAIRVEDRVCRWTEGGGLFFDDSFEHEAWNRTNAIRVILFVDFIRPLPGPLGILNRFVLALFRRSDAARTGYRRVMATQLNP